MTNEKTLNEKIDDIVNEHYLQNTTCEDMAQQIKQVIFEECYYVDAVCLNDIDECVGIDPDRYFVFIDDVEKKFGIRRANESSPL